MAVYQQMGHHSENLLEESELNAYSGAILSPVNYDLDEITAQVAKHGDRDNLELIFDPQLYYPKSERGCLRGWPYFPSELDTTDLTTLSWWKETNSALVSTLESIQPDTVFSPASVPRQFSTDYYRTMIEVGNLLHEACKGMEIEVVQTALINFSSLESSEEVLSTASVLSKTQLDRVFLVFITDVEPRRELDDTECLKGAMRLIYELENAGLRTLIGFCSSEFILWKSAGASDCATGKFFNLRRFTRSRFEEPPEGGGQLAYWFEESLFASLRESDVLRVEDQSLLSASSLANPYCTRILEAIKAPEQRPWVGLGWRQYLYWFADIEMRLSQDSSLVSTMLREADRNWEALEDNDVLMEERRNDGRWIRPWRRALAEFLKD